MSYSWHVLWYKSAVHLFKETWGGRKSNPLEQTLALETSQVLIRQVLALPEKMSRQSLGALVIRMKRARDLCSTYCLGAGRAMAIG